MLVSAYCVPCFKKLSEFGEAAQLHYIDVCESITKNKEPFHFSDSCHCCDGVAVTTKFLESKGYLISTECDLSLIHVIPNGHQVLEEGLHLFCTRQCEQD
jgi:hypothetical protein